MASSSEYTRLPISDELAAEFAGRFFSAEKISILYERNDAYELLVDDILFDALTLDVRFKRIQALIAVCQSNHAVHEPYQAKIHEAIFDIIHRFYQQKLDKPKTLDEKIDLALAMCQDFYTEFQQLIITKDSEFNNFIGFLKCILGTENITLEWVNTVIAKRKIDAGYLPGVTPEYLEEAEVGEAKKHYFRKRLGQQLQITFDRHLLLRPVRSDDPRFDREREWKAKEAIAYVRSNTPSTVDAVHAEMLWIYQQNESIIPFVDAIEYADDETRSRYRKLVVQGKLVQWNEKDSFYLAAASTAEESSKAVAGRAAFVINARGELYSASHQSTTYDGQVEKQRFHSSFMRGGPVLFAGELEIDAEGNLTKITNSSGHYKPNLNHLVNAMMHLQKLGVNLDHCVFEFSSPTLSSPRTFTDVTELNEFYQEECAKLQALFNAKDFSEANLDQMHCLMQEGAVFTKELAFPIHEAIKHGYPTEVILLLAKSGYNVDAAPANQLLPIVKAAAQNQWDLVIKMIQLGARFEDTGVLERAQSAKIDLPSMLLHEAFYSGNVKLVRAALNLGGQFSEPADRHVLHAAARAAHWPLLFELLTVRELNLFECDEQDQTFIDVANSLGVNIQQNSQFRKRFLQEVQNPIARHFLEESGEFSAERLNKRWLEDINYLLEQENISVEILDTILKLAKINVDTSCLEGLIKEIGISKRLISDTHSTEKYLLDRPAMQQLLKLTGLDLDELRTHYGVLSLVNHTAERMSVVQKSFARINAIIVQKPSFFRQVTDEQEALLRDGKLVLFLENLSKTLGGQITKLTQKKSELLALKDVLQLDTLSDEQIRKIYPEVGKADLIIQKRKEIHAFINEQQAQLVIQNERIREAYAAVQKNFDWVYEQFTKKAQLRQVEEFIKQAKLKARSFRASVNVIDLAEIRQSIKDIADLLKQGAIFQLSVASNSEQAQYLVVLEQELRAIQERLVEKSTLAFKKFQEAKSDTSHRVTMAETHHSPSNFFQSASSSRCSVKVNPVKGGGIDDDDVIEMQAFRSDSNFEENESKPLLIPKVSLISNHGKPAVILDYQVNGSEMTFNSQAGIKHADEKATIETMLRSNVTTSESKRYDVEGKDKALVKKSCIWLKVLGKTPMVKNAKGDWVEYSFSTSERLEVQQKKLALKEQAKPSSLPSLSNIMSRFMMR